MLLTAVTTILGLMPMALGMDINFFRWPDPILLGVPSGVFLEANGTVRHLWNQCVYSAHTDRCPDPLLVTR